MPSARKACPTCLQEFPADFGVCPIHSVSLVDRGEVPRAPSPPSSEPVVLARRFELGPTIGEGGMARVHLGKDRATGEEVAIKVLSPAYAKSARERERFVRESQTIGRISHPNVVRLVDATEGPGGAPALVMERLVGESLSERLKRGDVMPIDDALSIAEDVCRGLRAAHLAGVVHRDIKPGNVFLARHPERAVVVDFGLAKTFAATALTEVDMTVGTAAYMPPEQLLADPVDERTDVFAVGILLYRMLTRRLPYDLRGKSETMAHQIIVHPSPPSSLRAEVTRAMDVLVLTALRKVPKHRFAHIEAMADALRAVRLDHDAMPPVAMVGREADVYEPRTEMSVRVTRALYGVLGLEAPF